MRSVRVLFVISVLFGANVSAKRFETRCKLVREMIKVGMANDLFLGQWVCLIEKVSNRDTKTFVVTPSGKKYYGLYQIPSRWCREGKRGGECNIACESLLDDDIRDDTACAVSIFHREGFKYWSTWTARCKNDDLITKEIYKCPDLNSPRASPERLYDTPRSRRRLTRSSSQSSLYSYYGIHGRVGVALFCAGDHKELSHSYGIRWEVHRVSNYFGDITLKESLLYLVKVRPRTYVLS